MPIVSINFSTSQENINKIGLRSWKKFGAEYQLIEGENLEDAKKALKDFVYCSLKKQAEEVPEETIQAEQSGLPEEQQIIEGINSSNKQWLEKLWKMKADYSPKTREAYDKKYSELNT